MNVHNIKINKRNIILSLMAICLISIITFIGLSLNCSSKTKQADEAMDQKDYDKAIMLYGQSLKFFNNADIELKLSNAEELQKSKKAYDDGVTYFNNKDYNTAFLCFGNVIEKDNDDYDNAQEKKEESKNLYVTNRIEAAKDYASKNNYIKAMSTLDEALYIDPNNKNLLDLRSQYDSTQKKIKEEADAKAKADAEAKSKADADARKKAEEEEAKKYQPQKIVDSNGKQIWKVYISNSYFHFTGTYKGTGNFIVKLSNSNQELVALIANEIGDFVSDKTVTVPYVGWYYLEINGTDGKWDYKWQ